MKKTVVLTVFSYLFFILGIVGIVCLAMGMKTTDPLPDDLFPVFAIVGMILFVLLGTIAHLIAADEQLKVLSNITMFPFIFGFLVVKLVLAIKQLLTQGANTGNSGSQEAPPKYVVNDDGFKRTLTLFSSGNEDYNLPAASRFYDRYKDDIGNFWRTYNKGKSFIKETYQNGMMQ